jgi:hypothetical protein
MAKLTRPWTDEDIERMKELAAGGASLVRAAAVLKRSMISVRTMARKHGTPFPSLREARQRYTEARDKALSS